MESLCPNAWSSFMCTWLHSMQLQVHYSTTLISTLLNCIPPIQHIVAGLQNQFQLTKVAGVFLPWHRWKPTCNLSIQLDQSFIICSHHHFCGAGSICKHSFPIDYWYRLVRRNMQMSRLKTVRLCNSQVPQPSTTCVSWRASSHQSKLPCGLSSSTTLAAAPCLPDQCLVSISPHEVLFHSHSEQPYTNSHTYEAHPHEVLAKVRNWWFGFGSGLEPNWNSCNGFHPIKQPNHTEPASFWPVLHFRKLRTLAPIKYLSCNRITIWYIRKGCSFINSFTTRSPNCDPITIRGVASKNA